MDCFLNMLGTVSRGLVRTSFNQMQGLVVYGIVIEEVLTVDEVELCDQEEVGQVLSAGDRSRAEEDAESVRGGQAF